MIRYRFNARMNGVSLILSALPLLVCGATAAGAFALLLDSGIGGRFFLLSVVLLLSCSFSLIFLYSFIAMLTTHYVVERYHLSLHLGFKRYRLPLSLVEVKKYKKHDMSKYWRTFWGRSASGSIWAAACLPISDQMIYLQCQQREVVINPADHVGFLSALYRVTKLRELAPRQKDEVPVGSDLESISVLRFPASLKDSVFSRLLLLNAGFLFCLTGIIMQGIGYLPRLTILRYTLEKGIIIDSVPRDGLLVFAGVLWVLFLLISVFSSVVHRYERIAAYIALGFFPFIQLVVFVAVYGLFKIAG